MKKSFVLDTNVLLHNPAAIESFADNEVVIPMDVIEELDRFKGQNNELGRNARQVVRTLDRLRGQGSLRDGVTLKETGGTVRVALEPGSLEGTGLRLNLPDNRIVAVANEIKNVGPAGDLRLEGRERPHQVRRARHQDDGLREGESGLRHPVLRLARGLGPGRLD